jgi:hypothetical protein
MQVTQSDSEPLRDPWDRSAHAPTMSLGNGLCSSTFGGIGMEDIRRTARRLGHAALLGVVNGASTTAGSAIVALVIWWTHRS